MKILMVCEFFDNELQYQENLLAKYYNKHQHEVIVVTSLYESIFDFYESKSILNKDSKIERHKNLTIFRMKYSYNIMNKVRKFSDFDNILNEVKPDLIFIHDIQPNIIESIKYVKNNPSCKLIMDYHADYSNSANNWLSLNILHKIIRKRFFLDPALKYISKIFPVVPASAKFLMEVYKVPEQMMDLLPLGSDTDTAEQVKQNRDGEKIRKQLNIQSNEIVIFSGGKLQGPKKTELLIEAFLKLNREDVQLIIIGDSSKQDQDYKEMLVNLANHHPRIHFIGWLNSLDVYKYINAADLAVFPASQSILWQQVISMGLPLIAGDTGDQSIEYLNDDDNIVVLPKERINANDIQKEINRIIEDVSILDRMKKGALKANEKYLNWNNLIKKTLKFNT